MSRYRGRTASTTSGGTIQSDPILVIDSSTVHEGKLEALKAALEELVEFVEATEPDAIAYAIYFDEHGTRMTVCQIHPSSASMEFHMQVAGPRFRKLADLLTLSHVDVYGKPSDAVLHALRQKAELLGAAPVVVNELHAGFERLGMTAGATPRTV